MELSVGIVTDLVATFDTRQTEPGVVVVLLPWLRLVGF